MLQSFPHRRVKRRHDDCAVLRCRAIIEPMGLLIFVKDYLVWHYTRALRDFFGISRDLLWFGYHFFSLPLLARTLVTPFSRIRAGGVSILDIESSLQNIALNLIARAVGLCLRIAVIAAGSATEIILAVLLVLAFLCWLMLPFIIIFLLAFGAYALS